MAKSNAPILHQAPVWQPPLSDFMDLWKAIRNITDGPLSPNAWGSRAMLPEHLIAEFWDSVRNELRNRFSLSPEISMELAWLVLAENAFLLGLGLAAGTVSALLAVAPHLIGMGADFLWLRILGLLAAVVAVGLLAGGLAVWSTLRVPVLTALRRE